MDNLKLASVREDILGRLNPNQREAAVNYQGACIINAGPGSGKTATLVSRAAYMIEDGVSPYNILLFTFTRKAANEIRERVQKKIGSSAKNITVGTYHSFCMKLLRQNVNATNYSNNFSVYDDDDKKSLLKPIVESIDKNLKYAAVANVISKLKQELVTPAAAKGFCSNSFEEKVTEIYSVYQQKLLEANAMDFDDLIFNTIKMLEDNPDIKQKVNNTFKYIVCDEAHDSSVEDLRLIELLGGQTMNVCMILDCDQSIYSFRGANMGAVYDFMEKHKFRQFFLEQNYRSTQTIVDASRSMIENNHEPIAKNLYSKNAKGTEIVYYALDNSDKEAIKVANIISAERKIGTSLDDIAILFRTQLQSRKIEDILLRGSIPYRIVGGHAFYSRMEIKDILAYVKFAINPFDQEAFKRAINTPKRGIGPKALESIFSLHNTEKYDNINSEKENILQSCTKVQLKGKAKTELKRFVELITFLQDFITKNKPADVLEEVIKQTNYVNYLKDYDDKVDDRLGNLLELQDMAAQYDDIYEFICNMVLNDTENEDEEDDNDKVTLMTLHASKGLEFPVVIIIGCNEGTIPHFRSISEGNEDEERRLFYVGMTRAMHRLYLTRAKTAFVRGMPEICNESRFIGEIDDNYIVKI